MAKDLRTFLKDWEKIHPEDIIFVDEPVSVKYDTAALQHKLEKQSLFPILIFRRPVTVEGKESPFPLMCNLMASRRRCAEAIGTTSERVPMDYVERISARIKPQVIEKTQGPVKEVIERENIDLFKFPIPIHHENTSGKDSDHEPWK